MTYLMNGKPPSSVIIYIATCRRARRSMHRDVYGIGQPRNGQITDPSVTALPCSGGGCIFPPERKLTAHACMIG